jgi:hypothetical protein
LAIIEANKPVAIALANALIDDPERMLNSVEIDQCIDVRRSKSKLSAEGNGRRA